MSADEPELVEPIVSIDIERAASLEELSQVIADTVGQRAEDGLMLRSASHATDPEAAAEQRWSVLMVFTNIRATDLR